MKPLGKSWHTSQLFPTGYPVHCQCVPYGKMFAIIHDIKRNLILDFNYGTSEEENRVEEIQGNL